MPPDMTTTTTSPLVAKGRVLKNEAGTLVFQPAGTTYELHLTPVGTVGEIGTLVTGTIRAKGRKLYTVPSGGLFVGPILGTPKTFQGRVREVGRDYVVIGCGVPVRIDLPQDGGAVELANGGIKVGSLVNVIAFAGVTFEQA